MKNINNKTKLLISILLFPIVVCGQTINDWKIFDHLNYSISYPSTWELNHDGQMGTSFIISSPLESDNDNFKENVNLVIQDL